MASGKTHAKVNKIVIIFTAIVATILFTFGYIYNIEYVLIFALGIVFGFLFGPDLDIDSLNIDEYRLGKIFSYTTVWLNPRNKEYVKKCINGWVFIVKIWWIVYGLAIKHRSPFSHLPILADIIRISYFIFSLMFIFSGIYFMYLAIWYYFGWIPDINSQVDYVFTINMDLITYIYSMQDWQYKITFILGSSLMTLSHLMMDGFKIRW